MPNVNSNKNQNTKALVIMAILGLLGLNVYQFVNNRNLRQDSLLKESELVELENAKSSLEKEYQQAINNLEDMKTNNEELNKIIDTQKEELRLQKDKIAALLKDSKNLSLARKELEAMRSKAADYVAEINKLKVENEKLAATNLKLTTDKEKLSKEIDSKSAENQRLTEAKNQLRIEKESLSRENTLLTSKINRASSITVEKIKAVGYKEREGKKPNDVSKAKDVDFLRICFKTGVNMNADAGQERFYIRVIDPVGSTLALENQGSGLMVNETTGSQMKYTTYIDTEYANDEKEVCSDWKNPNGFTAGTYQIEIFNKGYLVGTSRLKLK